MFKRILLTIFVLAIMGTGGYFIYKYYGEAKDYKQQLESTQALLSTSQAQLAEIGAMDTIYQTAVNVKSGEEIKAEYLVPVNVPESAISPEMRIKPEDVIGKKFRLNMKAGATMTTDLLMTDEESESGTIKKFPKELTFDALPVTLEVGEYVDLRYLIASGEEYVVIDHAIVKGISNNTITIWITEEENVLLNSLYVDLGAYNQVSVAYLYEYLEPGNAETIPFYPVVPDIAEFIRFNPNLVDITRLENVTLRKHLDEVLTVLSSSNNGTMSAGIMSVVSSQLQFQNAARVQYLADKEEAEANGVPLEGYDTGIVTTGDGSYDVAAPTEEIDTEVIE